MGAVVGWGNGGLRREDVQEDYNEDESDEEQDSGEHPAAPEVPI